MAFWSDFLKVMKSTLFKNVLKNGDYSVQKLTNKRNISVDLNSESSDLFDGSSNVSIGVKNTLPIKHGGTGATDPATAREKLGVVSKSGDTINGDLIVKKTMKVSHEGWAGYETQSTNNYTTGSILVNDGVSSNANDKAVGQLILSSRRRPADDGTEYCYERFRLPNSSSVRVGDEKTVNPNEPSGTGQVWYDVLTTKKPVTVAQGGTGATNEATARKNLGLSDFVTKNVIPIENGGTNANNATSARMNLGFKYPVKYTTHKLNGPGFYCGCGIYTKTYSDGSTVKSTIVIPMFYYNYAGLDDVSIPLLSNYVMQINRDQTIDLYVGEARRSFDELYLTYLSLI